MPLDTSIKKVLVIGSGPIVIGQAAEFDYAGTQACHVLKEAGVDVVLCHCQRRHLRGHRRPRPEGLYRAVPPRGLHGPQGYVLPL